MGVSHADTEISFFATYPTTDAMNEWYLEIFFPGYPETAPAGPVKYRLTCVKGVSTYTSPINPE